MTAELTTGRAYCEALRADARQILATCTAETWRPLVAWAVGVTQLGHATCLAWVPLDATAIGPESHGGTLASGRDFHFRRSTWQVYKRLYLEARRTPDDRLIGDRWYHTEVIVAGRWAEVARLVTLDRIGPSLHAQIVDACRVRRERTPTFDPRRPSSWHLTPEAERERVLWAEIERHCEHLGALAWRTCRPVPTTAPRPATQLSLFDMAA